MGSCGCAAFLRFLGAPYSCNDEHDVKQPFLVLKYVFGTFCKRSIRTVQSSEWTCLPAIPGYPHDEPGCSRNAALPFYRDNSRTSG
jgi:hypothetical protein